VLVGIQVCRGSCLRAVAVLGRVLGSGGIWGLGFGLGAVMAQARDVMGSCDFGFPVSGLCPGIGA